MFTYVQVAATPVENQHPAVNDEAKGFKECSLNPSQDHQGNHGDVDDPDEDTSTKFANQTDGQKEDPIDNPVDSCKYNNNRPPGEGDYADDTELPCDCGYLDGDDHVPWKLPMEDGLNGWLIHLYYLTFNFHL